MCHPQSAPHHQHRSFFQALTIVDVLGAALGILYTKVSARYWTYLHLQLEYWSSLLNTPGGSSGLTLSNTSCLVLRPLYYWCLKMPFWWACCLTASAAHSEVWRPSLSKSCSFTVTFKNFSYWGNQPLSASSMMRTCWRIEVPLDILLLRILRDLAGVPFFDRIVSTHFQMTSS